MTKIAYSLISIISLFSFANAALVGHWTIDEGTGTTTTDLVSSTAATLGTGVTWSTDTDDDPNARSAYSASFPNTTAGFISTGLNATEIGIAGTGAKTIVGWFKTSSQEQQMFFGYSPTNGTGAGQDLRLGHDANGNLRFEVSSGFALTTAATVDDGAWHKVAIIINAGDTTSDVEFYLDGSILTPTSSNGRAINTLGASANGAAFDQVLIGNTNPLNATQAWDGLIDEVRVYDTALTVGELNALQPIPEPSSALATLSGFLIVVIGLRRRVC